jgi:hypothetical protein
MVRWLAPLAILLLAAAAGCGPAKQDTWIEAPAMADGRTLEVQRTVIWRFGGGELSQAFTRFPNEYALEFVHPRGATVRWHGETNVHPVALHVTDDAAYLAVHGNVAGIVYRKPDLYGCPEVPYAFLRYDLARKAWTPVAARSAPVALRRPNLSARWSSYATRGGRVGPAEIARINDAEKRSTSGHFADPIPLGPDEWDYRFAKLDKTTRYEGDCRPALDEVVDVVFPMRNGVLVGPVTAGELEILQRQDFSPPWKITPGDPEVRKLVRDEARSAACTGLFRPADPGDARTRYWSAFAKEPARLTGQPSELCDEDVMWFFGQYSTSPRDDRQVIAKVSHAGEVLYRLSFRKPNYWGYLARTSFVRKDGYLYFDWWEADGDLVKAILKMRMKEPG